MQRESLGLQETKMNEWKAGKILLALLAEGNKCRGERCIESATFCLYTYSLDIAAISQGLKQVQVHLTA